MTAEKPNLRRAEWMVTYAEHADAVDLIEETHYAGGAPNTSVARHALRRKGDGRMRGVALWLPPTKPAAVSVAGDEWRGVLALSRLCLAPDVPRNGASFLLGASMAMVDRERWPWLLTYADTALGHTGGIYKATNWEFAGEVPGSDNWVDGAGVRRGRKRGGRNLSAQEMRNAGFTRLPPMPKLKFIHRTPQTPDATSAGTNAA